MTLELIVKKKHRRLDARNLNGSRVDLLVGDEAEDDVGG